MKNTNEQKKIYPRELKVMEVLWREGFMTARELAVRLGVLVGWKQTTSYTAISRCIERGFIKRSGDNFMCKAQITREEAEKQEIKNLINKVFDGNAKSLLASLLDAKNLTPAQLNSIWHTAKEFSNAELKEQI